MDLQRAQRAWCLYDWANSAFATSIMAALFPPFFRDLAVAAGRSPAQATALWGYVTAAALLLLALSAPLLGAAADSVGRRKRFLLVFAGLGMVTTGLMATLGGRSWHLAALVFVVANFGFGAANIFYESLLPGLASGRGLDQLSARAYSWGYAGGGVLLVLNLVLVLHPDWFHLASSGESVRLAFLSVALWWGVFSVPLVRWVPEPVVRRDQAVWVGKVSFRASCRRLAGTIAEITEYRQLVVFLAAYWLYNDGIGTIVKMATVYGAEIGIGLTDMIGALVLTQAVGIPCALLFVRLAGRWSARSAVLAALAVYVAICVGGFFMRTPTHFYLLAGAVGTVQGGAQALSRSLFAAMVPRHRSGEFFGFFSSSGKLAGVAGPLVFAVVSQVTGTGRLGILSLVFFFLLGGWLLTRVDFAAGIAAARRAEKSATGMK